VNFLGIVVQAILPQSTGYSEIYLKIIPQYSNTVMEYFNFTVNRDSISKNVPLCHSL